MFSVVAAEHSVVTHTGFVVTVHQRSQKSFIIITGAAELRMLRMLLVPQIQHHP